MPSTSIPAALSFLYIYTYTCYADPEEAALPFPLPSGATTAGLASLGGSPRCSCCILTTSLPSKRRSSWLSTLSFTGALPAAVVVSEPVLVLDAPFSVAEPSFRRVRVVEGGGKFDF